MGLDPPDISEMSEQKELGIEEVESRKRRCQT